MARAVSVESKVCIHSPRKERGTVQRDAPELRGRGFELSLDYNWIKKGEGAVVWPLGRWGLIARGCSLFQCYRLPVAVGSS